MIYPWKPLSSLNQSREIAKQIFDLLLKFKKAQGAVILLSGDLGSGKTTLTSFILECCSTKEGDVFSSPTFTYCHEYPLFTPLDHPELRFFYHFDLYRFLEQQESASRLLEDWQSLFPSALTVIEWPESLSQPEQHFQRGLSLHFSMLEETIESTSRNKHLSKTLHKETISLDQLYAKLPSFDEESLVLPRTLELRSLFGDWTSEEKQHWESLFVNTAI